MPPQMRQFCDENFVNNRCNLSPKRFVYVTCHRNRHLTFWQRKLQCFNATDFIRIIKSNNFWDVYYSSNRAIHHAAFQLSSCFVSYFSCALAKVAKRPWLLLLEVRLTVSIPRHQPLVFRKRKLNAATPSARCTKRNFLYAALTFRQFICDNAFALIKRSV